MNCYPATEQWISEVERGRSCQVTIPLSPEMQLVPGDTVVFALAYSRRGEPPEFVKGGDSVLVSLTDVLDLGTVDLASGDPLFQISWKPLGQFEAPATTSRRPSRARSADRRG